MMIPVSDTANPFNRFIRITTMKNTNTRRKEKETHAENSTG